MNNTKYTISNNLLEIWKEGNGQIKEYIIFDNKKDYETAKDKLKKVLHLPCIAKWLFLSLKESNKYRIYN